MKKHIYFPRKKFPMFYQYRSYRAQTKYSIEDRGDGGGGKRKRGEMSVLTQASTDSCE